MRIHRFQTESSHTATETLPWFCPQHTADHYRILRRNDNSCADWSISYSGRKRSQMVLIVWFETIWIEDTDVNAIYPLHKNGSWSFFCFWNKTKMIIIVFCCVIVSLVTEGLGSIVIAIFREHLELFSSLVFKAYYRLLDEQKDLIDRNGTMV